MNLKYLTQAGGKMGEKALQVMTSWSLKNGTPFYVMYGQTEATARMSFLPPEILSQKPGSIGKPVSGGAFEIEADSNELVYTGPNVGAGYADTRARMPKIIFTLQGGLSVLSNYSEIESTSTILNRNSEKHLNAWSAVLVMKINY
jgi:acyl-coenzyme A synthetase/AMP-(fatty) acid ligase